MAASKPKDKAAPSGSASRSKSGSGARSAKRRHSKDEFSAGILGSTEKSSEVPASFLSIPINVPCPTSNNLILTYQLGIFNALPKLIYICMQDTINKCIFVICCWQLFTVFNPYGEAGSGFLTVPSYLPSLVVSIGSYSCRLLYENYQRYKRDCQINAQEVRVIKRCKAWYRVKGYREVREFQASDIFAWLRCFGGGNQKAVSPANFGFRPFHTVEKLEPPKVWETKTAASQAAVKSGPGNPQKPWHESHAALEIATGRETGTLGGGSEKERANSDRTNSTESGGGKKNQKTSGGDAGSVGGSTDSNVHREEQWDAANSHKVERKKWADLKVGDVVLLMPGDEAPADCVILSSTSELGVNYIETSQLDGETFLKPKVVPSPLLLLKDLSHIVSVHVEPPDSVISRIKGFIEILTRGGAEEMQTKADQIERKRAETAAAWNFAGENGNGNANVGNANNVGGDENAPRASSGNNNSGGRSSRISGRTSAREMRTPLLQTEGSHQAAAMEDEETDEESGRETEGESDNNKKFFGLNPPSPFSVEGCHQAASAIVVSDEEGGDSYPFQTNEDSDYQSADSRGPMSQVADALGSVISVLSHAIGLGGGGIGGYGGYGGSNTDPVDSANVQVAENVTGGSRMVRFNMDHTLLRGVRLQGQDRVLALVIGTGTNCRLFLHLNATKTDGLIKAGAAKKLTNEYIFIGAMIVCVISVLFGVLAIFTPRNSISLSRAAGQSGGRLQSTYSKGVKEGTWDEGQVQGNLGGTKPTFDESPPESQRWWTQSELDMDVLMDRQEFLKATEPEKGTDGNPAWLKVKRKAGTTSSRRLADYDSSSENVSEKISKNDAQLNEHSSLLEISGSSGSKKDNPQRNTPELRPLLLSTEKVNAENSRTNSSTQKNEDFWSELSRRMEETGQSMREVMEGESDYEADHPADYDEEADRTKTLGAENNPHAKDLESQDLNGESRRILSDPQNPYDLDSNESLFWVYKVTEIDFPMWLWLWLKSTIACLIMVAPLVPVTLTLGTEMMHVVQLIYVLMDEKLQENRAAFDKKIEQWRVACGSGSKKKKKSSGSDAKVLKPTRGGPSINNIDVLEDLPVRFIVSDKTGTLTKNQMIFRAVSIGNGWKTYGLPQKQRRARRNHDLQRSVMSNLASRGSTRVYQRQSALADFPANSLEVVSGGSRTASLRGDRTPISSRTQSGLSTPRSDRSVRVEGGTPGASRASGRAVTDRAFRASLTRSLSQTSTSSRLSKQNLSELPGLQPGGAYGSAKSQKSGGADSGGQKSGRGSGPDQKVSWQALGLPKEWDSKAFESETPFMNFDYREFISDTLGLGTDISYLHEAHSKLASRRRTERARAEREKQKAQREKKQNASLAAASPLALHHPEIGKDNHPHTAKLGDGNDGDEDDEHDTGLGPLDAVLLRKCQGLLMNLSINHTVHCTDVDLGSTTLKILPKLFYFATSPDELSLVATVSQMGLVFTSRSEEKLSLDRSKANVLKAVLGGGESGVEGGIMSGLMAQLRGQNQILGQPNQDRKDTLAPQDRNLLASVEVRRLIEFDSDRKRMTVFVRVACDPPGVLRIFCKGADSSIVPFVDWTQEPENPFATAEPAFTRKRVGGKWNRKLKGGAVDGTAGFPGDQIHTSHLGRSGSEDLLSGAESGASQLMSYDHSSYNEQDHVSERDVWEQDRGYKPVKGQLGRTQSKDDVTANIAEGRHNVECNKKRSSSTDKTGRRDAVRRSLGGFAKINNKNASASSVTESATTMASTMAQSASTMAESTIASLQGLFNLGGTDCASCSNSQTPAPVGVEVQPSSRRTSSNNTNAARSRTKSAERREKEGNHRAEPELLLANHNASQIQPSGPSQDQSTMHREADKVLYDFASNGWRTLCYSQKFMSVQEFEAWDERYMAYNEAIEKAQLEAEAAGLAGGNNINGPGDTQALEDERMAHIKSIEEVANFEFLGSTAVEDVLQDDVEEVLESFRAAGIMFWLLTGDKLETAVSIGLSSGLLTKNMLQLTIAPEGVGLDEEGPGKGDGKTGGTADKTSVKKDTTANSKGASKSTAAVKSNDDTGLRPDARTDSRGSSASAGSTKSRSASKLNSRATTRATRKRPFGGNGSGGNSGNGNSGVSGSNSGHSASTGRSSKLINGQDLSNRLTSMQNNQDGSGNSLFADAAGVGSNGANGANGSNGANGAPAGSTDINNPSQQTFQPLILGSVEDQIEENPVNYIYDALKWSLEDLIAWFDVEGTNPDSQEAAESDPYGYRFLSDGLALVVEGSILEKILSWKTTEMKVNTAFGKSSKKTKTSTLMAEFEDAGVSKEAVCYQMFLHILYRVHVVICCRVTPQQKAIVTSLAQDRCKKVGELTVKSSDGQGGQSSGSKGGNGKKLKNSSGNKGSQGNSKGNGNSAQKSGSNELKEGAHHHTVDVGGITRSLRENNGNLANLTWGERQALANRKHLLETGPATSLRDSRVTELTQMSASAHNRQNNRGQTQGEVVAILDCDGAQQTPKRLVPDDKTSPAWRRERKKRRSKRHPNPITAPYALEEAFPKISMNGSNLFSLNGSRATSRATSLASTPAGRSTNGSSSARGPGPYGFDVNGMIGCCTPGSVGKSTPGVTPGGTLTPGGGTPGTSVLLGTPHGIADYDEESVDANTRLNTQLNTYLSAGNINGLNRLNAYRANLLGGGGNSSGNQNLATTASSARGDVTGRSDARSDANSARGLGDKSDAVSEASVRTREIHSIHDNQSPNSEYNTAAPSMVSPNTLNLIGDALMGTPKSVETTVARTPKTLEPSGQGDLEKEGDGAGKEGKVEEVGTEVLDGEKEPEVPGGAQQGSSSSTQFCGDDGTEDALSRTQHGLDAPEGLSEGAQPLLENDHLAVLSADTGVTSGDPITLEEVVVEKADDKVVDEKEDETTNVATATTPLAEGIHQHADTNISLNLLDTESDSTAGSEASGPQCEEGLSLNRLYNEELEGSHRAANPNRSSSAKSNSELQSLVQNPDWAVEGQNNQASLAASTGFAATGFATKTRAMSVFGTQDPPLSYQNQPGHVAISSPTLPFCNDVDEYDLSLNQILDIVKKPPPLQATVGGIVNQSCGVLAVGDGANDVSMIRQADVGVGIRGKEGAMACQVADFSLEEFKHLRRLVMVHGHSLQRAGSVFIFWVIYRGFSSMVPAIVFYLFCNNFGTAPMVDDLCMIFNWSIVVLVAVLGAVQDRYCYTLDELERVPQIYRRAILFLPIESSVADRRTRTYFWELAGGEDDLVGDGIEGLHDGVDGDDNDEEDADGSGQHIEMTELPPLEGSHNRPMKRGLREGRHDMAKGKETDVNAKSQTPNKAKPPKQPLSLYSDSAKDSTSSEAQRIQKLERHNQLYPKNHPLHNDPDSELFHFVSPEFPYFSKLVIAGYVIQGILHGAAIWATVFVFGSEILKSSLIGCRFHVMVLSTIIMTVEVMARCRTTITIFFPLVILFTTAWQMATFALFDPFMAWQVFTGALEPHLTWVDAGLLWGLCFVVFLLTHFNPFTLGSVFRRRL